MPSSCDCRELLQFAFWGDSICSFQTVPLLWPRVHTVRANRITCFMCCTSEWQRVQDSRLEAKTPRGVPWHTIQTHPGNGQHLPGQSSTVSNCFRNPSLTPINRLFSLYHIWRWPHTWGHVPEVGSSSQHSLSWIPRNCFIRSTMSIDVLTTRTRSSREQERFSEITKTLKTRSSCCKCNCQCK